MFVVNTMGWGEWSFGIGKFVQFISHFVSWDILVARNPNETDLIARGCKFSNKEIFQPLASTSLNIWVNVFNFWVKTYFMSQFFVATSILDVSRFVKMLWFMSLHYENLIVVLSLFFLCCYFSLSTFHL